MVNFPIIRHVVYGNCEYEKRLDKDQSVRCYYCGKPIVLNKSTVSVKEDGVPIVECPNTFCRKKVSVLYYFDRVIDDEKKRLKKPLRIKRQAEKNRFVKY